MDRSEKAEADEELGRLRTTVDEYIRLYEKAMRMVANSDMAKAIVHEMCDDRRMKHLEIQIMRKFKRAATEGQREYMEELGLQFDPEMSYDDADRLIKKRLDELG